MGKLAVLFAGQGAQTTLMGKSFYDSSELIRNRYNEASEILGYDLTEIIFKESTLINQTIYTQPAILVTSLAIYETLLSETKICPDVLAGFSLGEYSALYASGIFDYNQIVHLIKKRAQYMDECAKFNPGKMAAIIGFDANILKVICDEVSRTNGLVSIANYNCPGQLVIGGVTEAVRVVIEKAKESGARRALELNVSGGFHTALMHDAAQKIYDEVLSLKYHEPNIPIIMNSTGDYLQFNELEELMKRQIESSVYFETTIRKMIADGVNKFIEIGPGNVLSGFVKKIDKSLPVLAINDLADLEDVKEWI